MEKFTQHSGIVATIPDANIDTDAIIPARFMRSASADLGKALFANLRYRQDGSEIPEFVLNREPFRRASIIVAGPNFGCGSSREAAVWALSQFGIRAVFSESFGEIFYENAFKNGLLPAVVSSADHQILRDDLARAKEPQLRVDLVACEAGVPGGRTIKFTAPAGRRTMLLEGLDEIGLTMQHVPDIEAFERDAKRSRPWVYDVSADGRA